MGAAWARHAMCESSFSIVQNVALSGWVAGSRLFEGT